MADSDGEIVESTEFMPFGAMREHSGQQVSDYKFTDQEFDAETGLYNYNARLYDPLIGRFISPDSIVQAPFDPQTLNRYAYARNNPLIYTDPSGHSFFGLDILIGAAIGATVAAIQGDNIWEGALAGAVSATIFSFAGFAIDYHQITNPILEGAIKGGAIAASKVANDAISNWDGGQSSTSDSGLPMMGSVPSVPSSNYSIGTSPNGSNPYGNFSMNYGGNVDYRFAYSANIVSQGHKCDSAFFEAVNKICGGVKKAVGHLFTEGPYAFKEASKATYDLALNGPLLARCVLGLAAATEIIPAAVVAGYYAPFAATTSLVWAGSPAGQNMLYGSVDFGSSYLPGVPKSNWYGGAGVSARYFNDYFFD